MFDHGCDSFTCALLTLMICKMMQVGNSTLLIAVLIGPTMTFYFCTLEEYYIGGLFLGPFNGVSDGSVLFIVLFLTSGIFGNDIWLVPLDVPIIGTYSFSYLFANFVYISQFFAVLIK